MTKKLKLWLLESVPMCATLLLTLIFIAPKHIPYFGNIMPLIHLTPVFIWSVMHPRDISLWALAAIGLWVDIATGLPLGLSALSYCLFSLLVRSQRKYIYKEGFTAMWGYFVLLLACMQIIAWALYCFHQSAWVPSRNSFFQWLLTLLFYPPMHRLFYPLVEKMTNARYQLLHG